MICHDRQYPPTCIKKKPHFHRYVTGTKRKVSTALTSHLYFILQTQGISFQSLISTEKVKIKCCVRSKDKKNHLKGNNYHTYIQWQQCTAQWNCPQMVWFGFMVFYATFNNISAISWRSVLLVGGNRNTRRKLLTCCKSLTNFIT